MVGKKGVVSMGSKAIFVSYRLVQGNHVGELAIGNNIRGDENEIVVDDVVTVNLAQGIADIESLARNQHSDLVGFAAPRARAFNIVLGEGFGTKKVRGYSQIGSLLPEQQASPRRTLICCPKAQARMMVSETPLASRNSKVYSRRGTLQSGSKARGRVVVSGAKLKKLVWESQGKKKEFMLDAEKWLWVDGIKEISPSVTNGNTKLFK